MHAETELSQQIKGIEDIDEDAPAFVMSGNMCDDKEVEEETQKIPL